MVCLQESIWAVVRKEMCCMQNGFFVDESMKNKISYDGMTYKFGITVSGKNFIVKYPKGSVSSLYSEFFRIKVYQCIKH